MSPASPGWYPDQNDPDGERLWDGTQWTDQRRPRVAAPPPAITPGVPWYRRTWIVALATFVIGLGLGIVVTSAGDDSPDNLSASVRDVTDDEPVDADTTEPEPEPQPAAVTLKAGDFKLKVKVREKQCFGSAGCSITYQIRPEYVGTEDVTTGSWDITYKVTGAEDPIINTMTLEDGTFSFDEEEDADTSSSSKQLYAKVTEVSEQ